MFFYLASVTLASAVSPEDGNNDCDWHDYKIVLRLSSLIGYSKIQNEVNLRLYFDSPTVSLYRGKEPMAVVAFRAKRKEFVFRVTAVVSLR
jgi:hypothetical protein